MTTNTEIIRQLYSGINRNDIDFVLTLMDSNIIRIEPEGFPTAGTYRGPAEMRKHLMIGEAPGRKALANQLIFLLPAIK